MATETAGQVGVPTWQLDPTHSAVEFSVKHMMMTTVRGRFKDVKATLTGDRDRPEAAGVEATIAVNSVDTGVADRDAHLRSADFFDAEQFPTITFRSTRVEQGGTADFRLVGDLTIRGVTKEDALDVTDEGRGGDPWGGTRAGFSLTGRVNRADFGLTWNAALETGGVVVGDEVKLEAEVEFIKA